MAQLKGYIQRMIGKKLQSRFNLCLEDIECRFIIRSYSKQATKK